ncbi:MAG: L-fucose:H+ symporter permease [Polyangia bacterium]|jgi:FHS family L-fucose permease-like MFS transporter
MAGPTLASASPQVAATNGKPRSYLGALAVLSTLFFMWGFITCLNDIIIPHLKAVFDLNYAQAMMIQFAFFTAYFVVSLPSGQIVHRVGYKRGIIIGLVVVGLGCLAFYPAAEIRSYAIFLLALFILASGITLLQVAANPFVAILGKPETASARLTLTQALNSLGTTLAPFFGSAFILAMPSKSADELKAMVPAAREAYRVAEAASVQKPYVGLALTLFVLAVAIAFSKLPKIGDREETASQAGGSDGPKSAFAYRHLMFGAVAIFVYVGGEVAIGSFLVNYLKEPAIAGLPEKVGATYLPYYWGGAMVGRFLGTPLLRYFKPGRILALFACVAALLVVTTMATSGSAAMWSVLAIGLFNSIMFPTIFTLAIAGLGKHTSQGSGILCMAIVGGALVPVIQGAIADRIGIHHCFIIPALCYLYIVWYGWKGHVPRRGQGTAAASA